MTLDSPPVRDTTSDHVVIGVDLGGSTIKAGLFAIREIDEAGASLRLVRDGVAPTPARAGRESMLNALVDAIDRLRVGGSTNVSAVGIGSPGLIDADGVIHGPAVNLNAWQGTSLSDTLSRRIGVPCVAGNDGSFAALAEARVRGARDLLFLSWGTGIGGGVVCNGTLVTGNRGMAGEIGHVSVDPAGPLCGCGQRGCLERFTGAPELVMRYRDRARGEDSAAAAAENDAPTASARAASTGGIGGNVASFPELAARHRYGDPVAAAVMDEAAAMVARVVGATMSVLAPEVVVIGGGVSEAIPTLPQRVAHALQRCSFPHLLQQCRVEASRLGNRAGMIGAAEAARDMVESRRRHGQTADAG